MLKVQRLNFDSSWWINWGNTAFIIDPWLIGSEIDGFAWLNEQWHSTAPIEISKLPDYQFIIISQSYEDHCHIETLKQLDNQKSILASPKAYRKIKKSFKERANVLAIPNFSEQQSLDFEGIKFYYFHPGRLLDPIYYAILMVNNKNEGLFYSPHGFNLNVQQQKFISQFKIQLLITTFSEFEIPAIMGGKVNPGLDNVKFLFEILKPKHILNTHDEKKLMKGLVSKTAKVQYPDFQYINSIFNPQFTESEHYEVIELM
jgi:hypothetical protein